MSECPYCGEPADESSMFCRSCGASLRLPEYARSFCPHCGARVAARQEFCHECHWSLVKAVPEEPAPGSEPPPLTLAKPSPWKNPWLWGLLVVAGLIIALLPWLFISGPPTTTVSESPSPKVIAEKPVSVEPAPAPPPTTSPAGEGGVPPASEAPLSAVVLKEQLTELLNQLREAQLKKDFTLYSQVFAPNFPDFDKRRQKTLAVWEAYDYSSLDFELQEVKVLEGDQAFARVTWNLSLKQKATQAAKTETQSYKVWFSKDGGAWRISNLEMVRKPD